MRNIFYVPVISLLILSVIIILNQCKEEEPLDLSPQLTYITSEAIGPEGGSIEIDDVKIIFANGALDHSAEIMIYEAINDDMTILEDRLIKAYRIEGIPHDITIPVKIEFDAPAHYEGEICLNVALIGKTIVNADTLLMPFIPFVCQDSEGLITGELPIFNNESFAAKKASEDYIYEFFATPGWLKLKSPNDKFYFRYKTTANTEYQVEMNTMSTVLDFYETSLDYYRKMGFEHEKRFENWPVEIKIIYMDYDDDLSKEISFVGYYPLKLFGFQSSYLQENSDLDLLKISTARNIGAIEASSYDGIHDWIKYGIGGWSEELWYNKNTIHLPYLLSLYPYGQLDCILNDIFGFFSCYNAPIIKYLVKHYEDEDIGRIEYKSKMAKIFLEIEKKSEDLQKVYPHIATIDEVLQTDHREWFPDFIKEYVTGELYPINLEPLNDKINHTFYNVEKGKEVSITLDEETLIGELATCWFKIELPDNTDLENTNIKLTAEGGENINSDYIELVIFSGKNISDVDFVVRGNPVYIDQIMDLVYDDDDIWIAMVKCQDEPFSSTTSSNGASLTMKVIEQGKEYYDGSMMTIGDIYMQGTYEESEDCHETSWDMTTGTGVELKNIIVTGNELTAIWNDFESNTYGSSGNVKIVFKDESLKEITDIFVYDYVKKGSQLEIYTKFDVTGTSINWEQGVEGVDRFEREGCAGYHLHKYVKVNPFASCKTQTMSTWSCEGDAKIAVALYY